MNKCEKQGLHQKAMQIYKELALKAYKEQNQTLKEKTLQANELTDFKNNANLTPNLKLENLKLKIWKI